MLIMYYIMCVVFSISLILQTFGLFFVHIFAPVHCSFLYLSVCFYSSNRKGLACYLSFSENVRRAVWFFFRTSLVCLVLLAWMISARAIYLVLDNQTIFLALSFPQFPVVLFLGLEPYEIIPFPC